MNLFHKISLAMTAIGLGVAISNSKKNKQPPAALPPAEPQKDTTSTSTAVTINYDLLMQKGSRGEEVKMLQKALGITADGIFGSITEARLMEVINVKATTLNNYNKQLAIISAQQKSTLTKQQIEAAFPIGKKVIALVDFQAYVVVFRNRNWFPTDLNGKELPFIKFAKTAQVGTVYSYDYQDPTIIIIALDKNVPYSGYYSIPSGQTYNKIRVKASWIK